MEKCFPGVEVDGKAVEVAASESGVEAVVRAVSGTVDVLGDGGPVEEESRGSVGAEVHRIDVSVEECVEL